jgi:hypothetical protein
MNSNNQLKKLRIKAQLARFSVKLQADAKTANKAMYSSNSQ